MNSILKFATILCALICASCQKEHTVHTSEIFSAGDGKVGVKAANSEILIAPDYLHIVPISKAARRRLPPSNPRDEVDTELLEYYQVVNEERESAVFDSAGNKIIDFCLCQSFQIDLHTKTIVSELKKGKYRNILHTLEGERMLKDSFENIGYINDSDLIALIKQDGVEDEFYLYNPFSNKKLGPYDHFNIYNKDYDPTMGIESIQFERLTEPIGVSVRMKDDWGFVDMKGEEVFPMKFRQFRFLTQDVRKAYLERSQKPEGVKFMFFARLKEDRSQLVFIDAQLKEYYLSKDASGTRVLTLAE